MKKNIQKLTEEYIRSRPSVKDCLNMGMINYSALTREIQKDLKIKNFDAILIACRRYRERIAKESINESKIRKLLSQSKLEIKNKIIIAVIEKPKHYERLLEIEKKITSEKGSFNLIEGVSTIMIVTNSEFRQLIEDTFTHNLMKINEDLVQIFITTAPEIEETVGVIAYVYSLFAENGINILEEMSCWTDIMVIIDEKDIAKAMGFLKF
ncbi:MAG: ACT domain-containing protein [Nanoarchaeota archaeon]|nr:ACT domain-containing protein [Nanoarchaeota archaeon]